VQGDILGKSSSKRAKSSGVKMTEISLHSLACKSNEFTDTLNCYLSDIILYQNQLIPA
jgi:hypothetical protein